MFSFDDVIMKKNARIQVDMITLNVNLKLHVSLITVDL